MRFSLYYRGWLLKLPFVILSASILSGSSAFSQIKYHIQDSVWVDRIIDGDTIPEEKFSAGFIIANHYDSCHARYLFSECKRNGIRLRLPNWVSDTTRKAWSAEQLTDSTFTETIKLATGDTISFYRDFAWYNKFTKQQDTNNYRSNDTLEYVVELVNKLNGVRLALLDSLGVLRRIPSGKPVFYGNSPVMKKVNYVVLPSNNNDSAFVRVRLSVRGDGQYNPVRLDQITVGVSDRLTDTDWASYRAMYNGTFKLSLNDLENLQESHDREVNISVVPNPSHGSIIVKYDSRGEYATSIAIYDVSGAMVASGLEPSVRTSENVVEFDFQTSGTYFVVLMKDGVPAKSHKVTVAR